MEINQREVTSEFNSLMTRLHDIVPSEAGFRNLQNYLRGLLGNSDRKNGWQMSEYVGSSTPYALQQFLYRGRFSADKLRDKLRDYTSENLGDEDGILVVDETGFLKQGKHSCGVKRQYSGTAGRIENCQIGVFLTYASEKGHAPLDRRLYMPQEWIDNAQRRKKSGVPENLTFQTKPQMALDMIKEATSANVPYKWVTGDCVYGDYTDIRAWLETNQKCYVMSVSGKSYVWQGYKQKSISKLFKELPQDEWFEASCGNGSKGERLYDWLSVTINPGTTPNFERSVVIRKSKRSPDELRAYICFAPIGTPIQTLVEKIGYRWTIETCFGESKSEVGLDQYEVRSYDGWYKHITLSCIALAFLSVLSTHSLDRKNLQQHNPSASSLEEFKKGRNLRV